MNLYGKEVTMPIDDQRNMTYIEKISIWICVSVLSVDMYSCPKIDIRNPYKNYARIRIKKKFFHG